MKTDRNSWIARHAEQGKAYVGHRQLNNTDSQISIVKAATEIFLLQEAENTLDFGCGWGRFSPYLHEHSKIVTGIDWVPSALEDMKSENPKIKVIPYEELPLPAMDEEFDRVWTCMVLQHIVDHDRFLLTCKELNRVAKPGAQFVMVENHRDQAPHVALRSPSVYINALGINLIHSELVSIDKEQSHWVMIGQK